MFPHNRDDQRYSIFESDDDIHPDPLQDKENVHPCISKEALTIINSKNLAQLSNRKPKKSNWSTEEDERLKEIISINGPKNWANIAEYLSTRTGKQCRQRWHNHLRDGVDKSLWTAYQYWILHLGVRAYGKKWSAISRFLPGRTDNTIKNQWNCKMKALKKDFNGKLEALLKCPKQQAKLTKKERQLLGMVEEQEESAKIQLSEENEKVQQLRLALENFEKLEEEIKEKKKMNEPFEISELSWRDRAIQGGAIFLEEGEDIPF